jgi:transposase
LIALTFVLTLEHRERFQKCRDVGCYVGLRPKQSESGQSQPQLRITKEGDRYLRTLLVRWRAFNSEPAWVRYGFEAVGLKLASRGGKNAKKARDCGGGAEVAGVAAPVVGNRGSVRAPRHSQVARSPQQAA